MYFKTFAMGELSKSEIRELFQKTCHNPDVMSTLINQEQVVYRVFNDLQKKPIMQILHEIKILDFLQQAPTKKCRLQIYLDIEDGLWKLVENTFLSGAEFVPQFLEHINKIENVKAVYKIVIIGSQETISNFAQMEADWHRSKTPPPSISDVAERAMQKHTIVKL